MGGGPVVAVASCVGSGVAVDGGVGLTTSEGGVGTITVPVGRLVGVRVGCGVAVRVAVGEALGEGEGVGGGRVADGEGAGVRVGITTCVGSTAPKVAVGAKAVTAGAAVGVGLPCPPGVVMNSSPKPTR